MIFVKNSRGGREVNMINTLSTSTTGSHEAACILTKLSFECYEISFVLCCLKLRSNVTKKKQYIYRHYPNWGWPPSLLPYFWQIYFWHSVDHVDLPPSPRIFDKNHEILGFEIYIVYYPYYFLRVWGTDRVIYHTKLSDSRVQEYSQSNKLYKIECFKFWQYVLWPPPSPTFVKN